MAKRQVESSWDYAEDRVVPFFLDLIAHRNVSNAIAADLDVFHQSPQLILVKDKKSLYDASHGSIQVAQLDQYL